MGSETAESWERSCACWWREWKKGCSSLCRLLQELSEGPRPPFFLIGGKESRRETGRYVSHHYFFLLLPLGVWNLEWAKSDGIILSIFAQGLWA